MSDNKLDRMLRWTVTVLAIATFIRVWFGPVSLAPEAHAQIPDTGKQRMLLIEENRKTNELLSEILTTLKSESISVRIDDTEKKNSKNKSSSRTGKRR